MSKVDASILGPDSVLSVNGPVLVSTVDKWNEKLSDAEKEKQADAYAQQILDNYDDINAKGKYITIDEIKSYRDAHSDLDPELKNALDFWSQEEAFDRLDTFKHGGKTDGDVSKNDLKAWIKDDKAAKDLSPDLFSDLNAKPDDKKAREDAEKAGIRWERPDDDKRSAKDIIEDTPLLKQLGNQSGVKDKLKDRVGDFEKDADAAYRAAQVVEHVVTFDGDGKRLAGKDVTNDRIDGFTNSGEARNGTEAGRLQDFGKYGFSNLKGKLHNDVKPVSSDQQTREQAEKLGIKWERPDGDSRSARDIIDKNPLLKNLGNQSGVKDMLKERVGDYEKDADAAYRATQVLAHIEKFDSNGNRLAGKNSSNDKIDGFTPDREAKPGTEAARLQDFGKEGFSALKGKLSDVSNVGDDKKIREEAEKLGFVWERPEGDKRSAKDIIDDNPLLKKLGNQSGIKDMLKDQVGDFENDADAAFRAGQVLDRVAMFDEKGERITGGSVANDSIDGFTNSGEAKNGTEAGRLQDFGKEGFSVFKELPKTDEIGSYKDFVKNNPDADETSKTLAKYAAILDDNLDAIRGKTGSGDYVNAEAVKKYAQDNTHLSDEVREALEFWSQPGAFDVLDTANNALAKAPDGDVGRNDLNAWFKDSAPTDAVSSMDFLKGVATRNALADVDTSSLGKDVLENPQNYSAEQKAAVLQELVVGQQLIIKGGEAGMWKDDKSKVTIANATRTHPDPEKVLKDMNEQILLLQNDPDVAEFMGKQGTEQLENLMKDHEGLKKSVEKTYKDEIKSGDALNDLWTKRDKEGETPTSILAEFSSSVQSYQKALGIDSPTDLQDAVKSSSHNQELQDYYKDSLVSGDRLKSLLKDNDFDKASSVYSMEVALYNASLDPTFTEKFDTELNKNYSDITQDNIFNGASFDDLKSVFGVDGTDELDEKKVEELIDKVREENPHFLLNQDGTVTTQQQVLVGLRGVWDQLRNGTKTLDKLGVMDSNGAIWKNVFKGTYDKGTQHGVSGLLLAGLTIAKGVDSGGKLNEKQVVDLTTGSIQTATILMEGGSKAYQAYLKDSSSKLRAIADRHPGDTAYGRIQRMNLESAINVQNGFKEVAKKFENAVKIPGGAAGAAMGAYSIFDGVQSLRAGDKLSGGMSITAGSVGIMAGLAGGVEGAATLLGAGEVILSRLGVAAGALGWVAAGVGAVAFLVPSIVKEVQQEKRVGKFADVLEDYVTKYGIDGVENGGISDIPDEEWPGYDDGPLIGS